MTLPPDDGEFAAIARFFAPLATGHPGALDLKDDAAIIQPPAGCEFVVTTDTLVAGVHFLPDDPAFDVAIKLLAVNLSDIAAMGGKPYAYLLSTALPSAWSMDERNQWLAEFSRGLATSQSQFGLDLIGGDTVSIPGPLTLTATVLGVVASGRALRRSGAQPGDVLCVSGTIGDAGLGLVVLRGNDPHLNPAEREFLVNRYRRPSPRVALGRAIADISTAAIDISDGLIADLGHLCTASGVDADIDIERVPLSAAAQCCVARGDIERADLIVSGDDYELLFTVPAGRVVEVDQLAAEANVPVSVIGRILAASPTTRARLHVYDAAGCIVPIARAGYRHF